MLCGWIAATADGGSGGVGGIDCCCWAGIGGGGRWGLVMADGDVVGDSDGDG